MQRFAIFRLSRAIAKGLLNFLEFESVDIGVDFYLVAFGEFTRQKFGGQMIFKSLLNSAF